VGTHIPQCAVFHVTGWPPAVLPTLTPTGSNCAHAALVFERIAGRPLDGDDDWLTAHGVQLGKQYTMEVRRVITGGGPTRRANLRVRLGRACFRGTVALQLCHTPYAMLILSSLNVDAGR